MIKPILLLAAVYGTLNGGNFTPAPYAVNCDGYRKTATLTEPQANALGYLLVLDEPPPCASNEYAVATGYGDAPPTDTAPARIRRTYEVRTFTEPPRRYSKLRLILALKAAGKWALAKQYIEAADLTDEWAACQYLEDGNAQFVAGTNAVIRAGLATPAEIAALLEAARDE